MNNKVFNPVLWEAYRNEIAEKGCAICSNYREDTVFGVRVKICDKNHPWVGHTTINRCKSGRVK